MVFSSLLVVWASDSGGANSALVIGIGYSLTTTLPSQGLLQLMSSLHAVLLGKDLNLLPLQPALIARLVSWGRCFPPINSILRRTDPRLWEHSKRGFQIGISLVSAFTFLRRPLSSAVHNLQHYLVCFLALISQTCDECQAQCYLVFS